MYAKYLCVIAVQLNWILHTFSYPGDLKKSDWFNPKIKQSAALNSYLFSDLEIHQFI